MVCRDLPQLRALKDSCEDKAFQKEWADVKLAAKVKAAAFLEQLCGIVVQPTSLFDVQVCLLCAQVIAHHWCLPHADAPILMLLYTAEYCTEHQAGITPTYPLLRLQPVSGVLYCVQEAAPFCPPEAYT